MPYQAAGGGWTLILLSVCLSLALPAQLRSNPVPLSSKDSTLDIERMVAVASSLPGRSDPIPMAAEEAERLALAGAFAPSGGNCRPWQFLHHDGRLFLFMDVDRARSALNPGLRYAFQEWGACLENMTLEAQSIGLTVRHTFLPLKDIPQLIAVLDIEDRSSDPSHFESSVRLASQIPIRCTNRRRPNRST